jgi:hypothetical protein
MLLLSTKISTHLTRSFFPTLPPSASRFFNFHVFRIFSSVEKIAKISEDEMQLQQPTFLGGHRRQGCQMVYVIFSNPKCKCWYTFEGLIMEHFGMFYDHLVF